MVEIRMNTQFLCSQYSISTGRVKREADALIVPFDAVDGQHLIRRGGPHDGGEVHDTQNEQERESESAAGQKPAVLSYLCEETYKGCFHRRTSHAIFSTSYAWGRRQSTRM